MEYLTLKNSDLRVSRLCMGGCPMGGYGWGAVQEQELVDAVHTALEQGINFFDTADTYGLGHSETVLGKALRNRRSEAVIATKFGVRVENGMTRYDNSPEWIREAAENSLRRLGTDHIDLYQIHYRDGKTPIGEVVEALEGLKRQGYIRFYGLSNIYCKDIPELQPFTGKFVSFQDEYSLVCRKNEADIKELSTKLRMTPLTWGSLGQGILTGKYDQNSIFGTDDRRSREIYENFHGEKLRENLRIVERMRVLAAEHDVGLAACAIRFILDTIPGSVALAGAKRPSQILSNVETFNLKLEETEIRMLEMISEPGKAGGVKLQTRYLVWLISIAPHLAERREAA